MWQFIYDRALVMFGQATSKAVPTAAASQASQGTTYHHTIWHTILLVIYFIICLGLVVAVLLQTTKNEGLSGVMGGSTQSVFKGKKGMEERLQEITNYLAVSFIVMSLLVTLLAFKTK